mmetsp:Transcript_25745/g.56788  ORF Transcript_25745/g.56788 Transcript_25745/m.56788 type:complete len:212 (-) Transcript_25745:642-1277(-)
MGSILRGEEETEASSIVSRQVLRERVRPTVVLVFTELTVEDHVLEASVEGKVNVCEQPARLPADGDALRALLSAGPEILERRCSHRLRHFAAFCRARGRHGMRNFGVLSPGLVALLCIDDRAVPQGCGFSYRHDFHEFDACLPRDGRKLYAMAYGDAEDVGAHRWWQGEEPAGHDLGQQPSHALPAVKPSSLESEFAKALHLLPFQSSLPL